ncbi:MAG: 3-deoxy-7-phosphoheptulonate synthase [Verrucomicrobia bacterium]|nr:3-deoxy-7-phosphoheptulonate synthase [Verrucomicrobiota bacterium]
MESINMNNIVNLRVAEICKLLTPAELKSQFPLPEELYALITLWRKEISNILHKKDKRFLAIVGPCSVHDGKSALDYAYRLSELRKKVEDKIYLVMRVYFEKPRTTIGWKGLINDPFMDGSNDIEAGLEIGRSLLLKVVEMGLPVATEFLDPIIPQYIDDLVCWSAIGARTSESQTHRELASGLSMPVGLKNGTDGRLQTAIDAMMACNASHSFVGIDEYGVTSVIRTTGNPDVHVVLRGGRDHPNYDRDSIRDSIALLEKAAMTTSLVIDCSHANSCKRFERQVNVWNDIIDQRLEGNEDIIGAMVESNINEGSQPLPVEKNGKDIKSQLKYGVSITDACLGWDDTEKMILSTYQKF